MLNLGDLGFLVFAGALIGLCYYFMVVRKTQVNLQKAQSIVNEDEEGLVDREQVDNPENERVEEKPQKTKSRLTSKQEARKNARKEEKRRQKEVTKED